MRIAPILEALRDRLIVSCQPVPGGPLDRPEIVADYVRATTDGGAAGFRIEGVHNIHAARAVTDLPIIGLVKQPFQDVPSWITGTVDQVDAIVDAGAEIVAIDATARNRPAPIDRLFKRAKDRGATILADISHRNEGKTASDAGADAVASTLSLDCRDETGRPCPDLALISAMAASLEIPIIAEGNVRTPADAAAAKQAGAWAVVVGSAITRPEFVTSWFADAMNGSGSNV
jgi:putative N-acetylmannosamine-6-phosphate epimerase